MFVVGNGTGTVFNIPVIPNIKKPWKIVTTSQKLVDSLSARICDKSHTHDPCQGSDTVKTGFYNNELSAIIVKGLCCKKMNKSVTSTRGQHKVLTGIVGVADGKIPPWGVFASTSR